MTKGTRKETIADIMEWSATWGSPLSREQAEAKADRAIKATRPRRGWLIAFIIVAVLWVWFFASIIVTSRFERGLGASSHQSSNASASPGVSAMTSL
jgi:hypothetical protein